MGHRAIVAYERSDGRFNCHYSHWGAHDLKLADDITDETPLGGEKSEPAFMDAFTQMLEDELDDDAEIKGEAVEDTESTDVDPQPFATGLGMEDVVQRICHVMHEAFYVVDREFDVHAFRTIHVPFAHEFDSLEDNAPGLLIEPEPHRDRDASVYGDLPYQTGKFRGVRDMLEAFTGEEGAVTAADAREAARTIAGGDTLDLAEYLDAIRTRANANGTAQLFTPAAAREVMIQKILGEVEGSLGTRVLSHSPLLTKAHFDDYPHAFVRVRGRTRVLGQMHATDYRDDSVRTWMLNDRLDLPEPVDGDLSTP